MGSVCSKKDEQVDEDETEGLYDPTKTFWDEHGNLRYGKKRITPKAKENAMREIMGLDQLDPPMEVKEETKGVNVIGNMSKKVDTILEKSDEEEEKDEDPTWYIMDSAWIACWLAHVHYDKENAPAPGPCRNNRLIEWDPEKQGYKGRFGLQMSVANHAGDYRRVTEECWKKYQSLYPGSGPTITMKFKRSKENINGFYDTSDWTILDPPPAPPITVINSRKKAKKAPVIEDENPPNPSQKRSTVLGGIFGRGSESDNQQLKVDSSGISGAFTPSSKTRNTPKLSFAVDGPDSDDDDEDLGPSDKEIEDAFFG